MKQLFKFTSIILILSLILAATVVLLPKRTMRMPSENRGSLGIRPQRRPLIVLPMNKSNRDLLVLFKQELMTPTGYGAGSVLAS